MFGTSCLARTREGQGGPSTFRDCSGCRTKHHTVEDLGGIHEKCGWPARCISGDVKKMPTIRRGQKMDVVAFCHLRRSICSFEALSGNNIIEEKWVPPRPSFPLNGLSTRGSLHFKQVATICSVPSEWRRVGVRSKSIGCLDLCTRHRMPLTLSPPSGVWHFRISLSISSVGVQKHNSNK